MSDPNTNGGALVPVANQKITGNWRFADNAVVTLANPMVTKYKPGLAPAATVTVVEKGDGLFRQTIISFSGLAMSLSQAHVGGGTKIYTFPEGNITILGATANGITPTTTSAILTTLNGGKTLSAGVGSVQTTTQDSGTLVTTQQDIINAFAPVSSATINVAGTAANGSISASTCLRYDGTATPVAIYLNCGVPTASDIDGDATTTWSGVVTISWVYNGDY
jgi:hypothetical protein